MKMAKFYLCVLGVVAVTLGLTVAKTEEEINAARSALRPFLDECGKEFGITRDQVLAVKANGDVDKLDPCFYACFFKKVGFIDANGLFDANVAVEKNKKYFKGAEDIEKIEYVGKTCTSVNEQTVSDGEKGCERAKLLLSCFLKEKSTFTPFES